MQHSLSFGEYQLYATASVLQYATMVDCVTSSTWDPRSTSYIRDNRGDCREFQTYANVPAHSAAATRRTKEKTIRRSWNPSKSSLVYLDLNVFPFNTAQDSTFQKVVFSVMTAACARSCGLNASAFDDRRLETLYHQLTPLFHMETVLLPSPRINVATLGSSSLIRTRDAVILLCLGKDRSAWFYDSR